MRKLIILSSLFLSASFGCAGLPIALTPSSSPVPPWVRGTIPTLGDDCQYTILGLFTVTPPLNTQKALQEAKEAIDVDVLTDVTVDFRHRSFILFSNQCVRLHGLGVPKAVLAEADAIAKGNAMANMAQAAKTPAANLTEVNKE